MVAKKFKDKMDKVYETVDHLKALTVPIAVFETFLGDLKRKSSVQDAQLKKMQDVDKSKTSASGSGFDYILGLGNSGEYKMDQNQWGSKEHELENEIKVIKNQVS